MQHSHSILAFKPLILFPPTLYLRLLHSYHRLMLLAASLYLLLFLSLPYFLRVLQWNAAGLRARSTELLHFISSHPVDLICIQESNLNLSSFFRIPGFSALRPDRTHSRFDIFSTDVTDASGGVTIFVRQGLSFSELYILPPLFIRLTPTNYVEVNISLNNSSSLSFLNVYAPLDALLRRIAERISVLPPSFPSLEISLFWEISIAITPSKAQKILPNPVRRKHSIGSYPLTSSPSMTLTYLLFFIAPLAVAPPLISSLLFSLSPYLAPGRCFRTWVLITYQFYLPSLFLRSFAPTNVSLP